MIKYFLLLILTVAIFAQEDKWDVNEVRGPHKQVKFNVKSGTWMNLDVRPDGQEIVFDLLGDLYKLPISGGKATLLSGGLAFELHPRYSHDGKRILFTSDRGGGDNIWTMDANGGDYKQITNESFRLCNNAVWSADSEYIITKKHFTGYRSLGAGELWLYHISGGNGIQLTIKKNDQQDVGEPCVSPDGQYAYFSEDMSGGSTFQYNKDPNGQIYVIRRVSLVDGKIENIIAGPGGAVRPQISPDGKLLAFVRRVRTKSVLFLHDLHSGEEWPVFDGLSKDQQETWATFGVYPNYSWMPDGKSIVLWAKGKIWHVNVQNLQVKEIPFEVEATHTIASAVKFDQAVSPTQFTAKMIRDTHTSSDKKKIVFNAAGYLWAKNLPNGTPQRLTKDTHFEFSPQFSPDGKEVVYITWSDADKGNIFVYSFATNSSRKLTSEQGYYHSPSFSSDGKKVIYRKGRGDSVLGYAFGKRTGIYIWENGVSRLVIKRGSRPQFNHDGSRIFFQSRAQDKRTLNSCDLNGSEEKTHFSSKYTNSFRVSPDGRWVAFTELFQSYIAAFPKTGTTIDLSANTKSIPLFKLSRDAGNYLHWSQDSQTVFWTLGQEYFSRDIKDCFTWKKDAPAEILPPVEKGMAIDLVLNTDMPEGMIALLGARIITMQGSEVIAHGTIVIDKNRIVAIGKSEEVNIPKKAKIINVEGKTIMPGIIDVHAHLRSSGTKISPQQQWSYYANLAYGVTTTHDPSSDTEMVFSQSEMVKAGNMVGPRIYSTGTILYGADGDFKAVINSLDDARSHLRRLKAVGAFSVKSYNQPRRNQRQQVITAARELEMMVYPEGGSFYNHNLSMVVDGHTGVEHSLPIAPVYKDVIQLWGNSKTGYTPTLIVGYGGIWGENYWYQKTNVWQKERLLKFTPRSIVDSRSRRRMMIPDEDFGHIKNAKACKSILDGGANVQLGAHGQLQGLGAHWELWMLSQGGFSEMEALRSATLMGAQYIGMDKEIGSLEIGKIADLIVLDQNPLENIFHTETVRYTMINGRLYDAETMHEVGNRHKERSKFFWEYDKTSNAFPWHSNTNSFTKSACGCTNSN